MKDIMKAVLAVVVWSVLMIGAGWQINTYYTGYQLNIKKDIEKMVDDGFKKAQREQAKQLDEKLNEIMKQPFKIQKEKETIITNPVYSTECIDEEGVKLLQKNGRELNEIRKKNK